LTLFHEHTPPLNTILPKAAVRKTGIFAAIFPKQPWNPDLLKLMASGLNHPPLVPSNQFSNSFIGITKHNLSKM
jgi:hypothetical protein